MMGHKRWEYLKINDLDTRLFQGKSEIDYLNRMGDEGWECFSRRRYSSEYDCRLYAEYFFKREV